MRCLSCDRALTDFESTRKYKESGLYIDLCNKCFHSGVSEQVRYEERHDLLHEEEDEFNK